MTTWRLIRQALGSRRWSWMAYSAIGLGFLLLYLPIFPSIQKQQQVYNQVLESMPKGVLEAFNITNASSSLMGFLTSKHFGFVWILMIILLMLAYAGGALAREIDNRTMGLLLALPVSRWQLYWTRLAGGVLGLAGFVAATELITWPLAQAFNYAAPWVDVLNVALLGFSFGLTVLCLGMMISAAVSDSSRVYSWAGGGLLVMYVLNIVAGLKDNLKDLKYLSLFHYVMPGNIIDGASMDWKALAVFAVISVAAAMVGAVVFARRDMSI